MTIFLGLLHEQSFGRHRRYFDSEDAPRAALYGKSNGEGFAFCVFEGFQVIEFNHGGFSFFQIVYIEMILGLKAKLLEFSGHRFPIEMKGFRCPAERAAAAKMFPEGEVLQPLFLTKPGVKSG